MYIRHKDGGKLIKAVNVFLHNSVRHIQISQTHLQSVDEETFQGLRLESLKLVNNDIHEILEKSFNSMTHSLITLDMSGNSLHSLCLEALHNIQTLTRLVAQRIAFADAMAFSGIENTLEYLDLERNHLSNVFEGLENLNRIRYLYLTANEINHIPHLPSTLKVLSLSSNNFTTIPTEALQNCTELSYLNMGYNKISDLPENGFISWGAELQTLLLRNNKITMLNYGSFNGLESIKEISLSFNDIHYVHPSAFVNISKTLKILELSFGIYREDIPLEALNPLTELMWLGLDNNNLKLIPDDSLISLKELTFVNIAYNRITVLPRTIFVPEIHKNLMDIDASYNVIERLFTNTFDELIMLQFVNLASNNIRHLERHCFHNLPFLTYIDLSYNSLRNVTEAAFAFLPNLLATPMRLNISHNEVAVFEGELSSYLYVHTLDASYNFLSEPGVFHNLGPSLRKLYLQHNNISFLTNHAFGDLEVLDCLNLSSNNISTLRRRSFQGLMNLQELDLSDNRIEQLQFEQFGFLKKLRMLNLRNNRLKSLPRDAFINTRIEYLDMSGNFLGLWPATAFSDIGFTLRSIRLDGNQIEYLDATMFSNTNFLLELRLAHNRITVLPDNTFSHLPNLTTLDISFNPLVSTNFKELLLYLPSLRRLNLRYTGLYNLPPMVAQSRLTELDISQNHIQDMSSLRDAPRLRVLYVAYNKIVNLTHFGRCVPQRLRVLDLSGNPIRKVTAHDFAQIRFIDELSIEGVKLPADAFALLRNLRVLRATSQYHLGEIISRTRTIRELHVTVLEEHIHERLFEKALNATKINLLDITGPRAKTISPNAFNGFARSQDLTVRLRNTLINDLPPGLFYGLKHVPRLKIDISDNLLATLSPDTFYPNASAWDAVGTRSIIGGLDVSGNPLQCDCGLVWLGHWLRRWLRETVQIHLVTKDEQQIMSRFDDTFSNNTGHVGQFITLAVPGGPAQHPDADSLGGTATIIIIAIAHTCFTTMIAFADAMAFSGIENTLEYLDLERNHLSNVFEGLENLNRIRYLYLTANEINHIPHLPSTLKVLSLSSNNFTTIPTEALQNCTELSYLNMGYNKISDLPENGFISWGAELQTLLLRNNKITMLNYGSFNGLESIKEISLSFNDIHYVHPSAFVNISKTLKILELSFGIYREDIPLEALNPLTELMWLGLDNNNLKLIPDDSLISLKELTFVNIAYNRITVLPRTIFVPEIHKNLMDIDASYNVIERLFTNTFDELIMLQFVNLASNNIRHLERHCFHNLPFLTYIDLSYNSLRNVTEAAFAFLPNLLATPMRLNISHNEVAVFEGELSSYLYVHTLDASYNFLSEPGVFHNLGPSLRKLYLQHNNISFLTNHAFGDLEVLDCLNLSSNNISTLRRRSFQGLMNLQELDLSDNRIEQLQFEQFGFLKKLRMLNLRNNRLKSLPRDAFINTRIEYLDMSGNFLGLWPATAFSDIGFTLRSIRLDGNQIEYLDATMFSNTNFLLELRLAHNRITVLPDNTFSHLPNLTTLDISFNPLVSTNFKELLLYLPSLRRLNLRYTGLYNLPPMVAQSRLTELDISQNHIQDMSSLRDAPRLRVLYVAYNKIVNLTHFGRCVPQRLRVLDLSGNPIRKVTAHDFAQIRFIDELSIEGVKLPADAFALLRNLRVLRATSQYHLGEIISRTRTIRELHVTVLEEHIHERLFEKALNATKINLLDITGPRAKTISPNAFNGFARSQDLTVRLRNTLINDLPPGLFYGLKHVPRLKIDISDNLLATLSPDTFYPNASAWDAVGTRSIIGGLDVSGNPLQCDCGLVWLGHWLRRWLRETVQIHLVTKDEQQIMSRQARGNTCLDPISGKKLTFLEIFPEDLLCHASALSSFAHRFADRDPQRHLFGLHTFPALLLIIYFLIL
uniref:Putative membrane glycoprotein lig-1 n=1 Tax=Lutzomyia longipalpis TaxID=7200 RepID=A0A1B0CY43_LUTLO